jgi:hypothetical protein
MLAFSIGCRYVHGRIWVEALYPVATHGKQVIIDYPVNSTSIPKSFSDTFYNAEMGFQRGEFSVGYVWGK